MKLCQQQQQLQNVNKQLTPTLGQEAIFNRDQLTVKTCMSLSKSSCQAGSRSTESGGEREVSCCDSCHRKWTAAATNNRKPGSHFRFPHRSVLFTTVAVLFILIPTLTDCVPAPAPAPLYSQPEATSNTGNQLSRVKEKVLTHPQRKSGDTTTNSVTNGSRTRSDKLNSISSSFIGDKDKNRTNNHYSDDVISVSDTKNETINSTGTITVSEDDQSQPPSVNKKAKVLGKS